MGIKHGDVLISKFDPLANGFGFTFLIQLSSPKKG
jgi:hypothetical protein